MQIIKCNEFDLIVLSDEKWDIFDDNIDVQVILNSGRRYAATLFSVRNISTLFQKFEADEDFAKGRYFWMLHGIIVLDLSIDTICTAIMDLIATHNIGTAMLEVTE